jgi:hypothetical protein
MTDMAEMAEGWYTDPAPANPAMPTTMRYWDGKGWTARTRAASRKELAAWREAVAVERHRQAEEHAAYVETYVAEHGTVSRRSRRPRRTRRATSPRTASCSRAGGSASAPSSSTR